MVYRTAESLVTEYTSTVARGGCVITSRRALPPGTRFVFEMRTTEHQDALEVEGEVVRVSTIDGDEPVHELVIRYVTDGIRRVALEAWLARIAIDPTYVLVRSHPRIPVNLLAHDLADRGTRYVVRDVSRGGVCIEGQALPPTVRPGARAMIAAYLEPDTVNPVVIRGSVVWTHSGRRFGRPRVGVCFDDLRDSQLMVVDGLTRLLRPSRLTIGFDATAEVPAVPPAHGSTQPLRVGAAPLGHLFATHVADGLATLPQFGLRIIKISRGPVVARSPDADHVVVGVGLTGDADGELRLDVEPALAIELATQLVGEPVAAADRQLTIDALTELVTVLGGRVCDRLERAGHSFEVVASTEASAAEASSVWVVELAGPGGRGALTVVTRDLAPSRWPAS